MLFKLIKIYNEHHYLSDHIEFGQKVRIQGPTIVQTMATLPGHRRRWINHICAAARF